MVSTLHEKLVNEIVLWIERDFRKLNPKILSDGFGPLGAQRPPMIAGYIPDVYCTFTGCELTIVGDAKTSNDIKSPHSRMQYQAFLEYLKHRNRGILVLSTLWSVKNQSSSLLRKIRKQSNSETVEEIRVITDMCWS